MHLIPPIPQLSQNTSITPPRPRQRRFHRWWTTNKHLFTLLLRTRHHFAEQFLRDIPLGILRAFARMTNCVDNFEATWKCLFHFREFVFEECISVVVDTEDEGHLRLLLWVLENTADELIHWGYASE